MSSRDEIISKLKKFSNAAKSLDYFKEIEVFSDTISEDKLQKFITECVKVSANIEIVESKNELKKILTDIIEKHKYSEIISDKKLEEKLSFLDLKIKILEFENFLGEEIRNDHQCVLEECYLACADTGTLVFFNKKINSNYQSLYPETHIVLINETKIIGYNDFITEVNSLIKNFQNVVCVTGPSRTADIEKKLVLGVHGPKNLYILIERK